MCLATIDSVKSRKRIGYKVVIKKNKSYYTGISCVLEKIKLSTKEFIRDKNKNFIDNRYEPGFHVCLNLDEAKLVKEIELDDNKTNLVIVKVLTKETVASGSVHWDGYNGSDNFYQFHSETIVVKEIKILEEVK